MAASPYLSPSRTSSSLAASTSEVQHPLSPAASWFPSAQTFAFGVASAPRVLHNLTPLEREQSAADGSSNDSSQQGGSVTVELEPDASVAASSFAFALASTRSIGSPTHPSSRLSSSSASVPTRSRTISGGGGSGGVTPYSQNSTPLHSPASALQSALQTQLHVAAPPPQGSRHHSHSGAEVIVLPAPDMSAAACHAAIAGSSAEAIVTRRLPPRIPSAGALNRLTSAGLERNASASASHSTPGTPILRTPGHSLAHGASTAANVAPGAAVPSLMDLSTPADGSEMMHNAASWNALSATTPVHASGSFTQTQLAYTPHASQQNSQAHAAKHSRRHSSSAAASPLDDPSISSEWRALLSRPESIDHVRSDPAVHALVASGVPDAVRPELWKLLSGSNEERRRYPSNYYQKLLQLHRLTGSVYDDEIRRDLARTLPGLPLFNPRQQPEDYDASGARTGTPGQGPVVQPTGRGGLHRLHRVLVAYATRNKSLGYCQGMNQLAATLLTLLEEEDAFWVLVPLIESRIGYYARSMCGLEVDQRVFGSLVSYYLPSLFDHLKAHEVNPASFTVSWFVCLFVESPLSQMGEIYTLWDRLLLWGDELVFSFSLTLLRMQQDRICKLKDTGDIMSFVLHTGFKGRGGHGDAHASNGSGATSGGDASAGGLATGHSVAYLLAHEVPRLGSLTRDISSLREFHRSEVLVKSRVLNSHAAARLATQFKFPSAQAVQELWGAFLAPSPWSVLLHSSLTSHVKFLSAFCSLAFPESVRMKWRDGGLASGLVARLFEVVDTDRTGEVKFESFLAAVHIFQYGGEEERCRFAFRVADADRDGRVGRAELERLFMVLQLTFHGASMPGIPAPSMPPPAFPVATHPLQQQQHQQQQQQSAVAAADASVSPAPSRTVTPLLPPPSTPSASSSTEEDAADVARMFADMVFSKAAEAQRYALLLEAERAADKQGSAAAAAALAAVPSHAACLASLLSRGLNYTQFRRVIALHPFTQITFQLALSDTRSFLPPTTPGVTPGATPSATAVASPAPAASSPTSTAPGGATVPAGAAASSPPPLPPRPSASSTAAAPASLAAAAAVGVAGASSGGAAGGVAGALGQSSGAVSASSFGQLLSSLDRSPPSAGGMSSMLPLGGASFGLAAGASAGGAATAAAAAGAGPRSARASRSGSLQLAMAMAGPLSQALLPQAAPAVTTIAPPAITPAQ